MKPTKGTRKPSIIRRVLQFWKAANTCIRCREKPAYLACLCQQCFSERSAEVNKEIDDREHAKLKRAVREVLKEIKAEDP